MSQEGVKKSGYLSKLPVKGLMKKWTRRWFILFTTTHEGVVRIEYFDSPECYRNGVGKRTIPLRDSSAPSQTIGNKLHPYVFQFRSQIGGHTLAADSQPEMEDWIDSIKQAVQEDRLRRRRTKGQSRVMSSAEDTSFESYNESGLSYRNKVDSGTYRVTVEETETSTKMCLSGTYSLELSPTMLSLTAPSGANIFTLSYKFLKNYGKQSGQFHFETGKNSPIGEGRLIFVTTCSKEVFGVVHSNIKRLREKTQRSQPEEKPLPEKSEPRPQTKSMPRPQPQNPVPIPPLPQKKKRSSSRPGSSRQSTEIADTSIPGTYRKSKDLEETKGGVTVTEPSAIYSQVDKSKKKSKKQQIKKSVPQQPKPYKSKPELEEYQPQDSQLQESLYADPYETDPAFKAPPVPGHKKMHTHDSRTSCALVEVEDNAFNDSFEEDNDEIDHGHTEPSAEGASDPPDVTDDQQGSPPDEASARYPHQNPADIVDTVESLRPPASDESGAPTSKPSAQNLIDFNFDFGSGAGALPMGGESPFTSNFAGMAEAGTDNVADFDFGQLDANFFEKLEAMTDDHPSTGPWGAQMNQQNLDEFWTNVDGTVQKFQ